MKKQRGETQNKILQYIKQEINKNGYPPSVREICDAVDLKSTSTVHGHLTRLEKNGFIKRNSLMPRAIKVLDNVDLKLESLGTLVPVVGRVKAGIPVHANEDIEEYIALPDCMIGNGDYFILKVVGDSMINVGINDGDNVVVKKQVDAKNGEIVVAMLDDETTIKRFYKENGYFKLQAENDDYPPIIVKDLVILGKITSLFRIY